MQLLQGRARDYAWGSPDAIAGFFGRPPARGNVAEIWLGAHPDDPATIGISGGIIDEAAFYGVSQDNGARRVNATGAAGYNGVPGTSEILGGGERFDSWIARNPLAALGESVIDEYGPRLPYLLKVIAPNEPLSLQVHPSVAQAIEGYEFEDAAGIAHGAPNRNYKDGNHKPELVYALTEFEALAGFRAPRRIRDVLLGLEAPLAMRLRADIRTRGVRAAFAELISASTRPSEAEVAEVVDACAERLLEGSPSPRADKTVGRLAAYYPGDPGVVASLLMNPVTLHPGESMFISAGTLHAYLKGVAVEIMAASDNVLRAGLTPKHVDVPELLRVLNPAASPPTRIAPEHVNSCQETFYAPVDDFELSSIRLKDGSVSQPIKGGGPRTVLCLRGGGMLEAGGERLSLTAGKAAFVSAADGALAMRGVGHFVQAGVP